MPLSTLLHKGTQQVELMPDPDPARLAETLIAFANAEGGWVVLGVDSAGRPTGALQPEDVDAALRVALSECRPLVRTEWEHEEGAAGTAVTIHVPRSTELHSLADGRVLVRTSEGNEPLDGVRITQLAAGKASGDFETEAVPGATRADLDEEVIHDFLERRKERLGREPGQDEDEILQALGALTAGGEPTTAGILLFGKAPQSFIPHSGVTYVRFPGTQPHPTGPSSTAYTRREEFTGALARVIERAWSVLLQELRGEAVVRGLQREDRYIYPQFAVREALVNAVCHRDYHLKGRRVEIRQFDDRLEIFSPGGLPGYITLDNIVTEHYSRNPRLVNGLFEWRYIEELGMGIDRMIEELLQNGHPQPEFAPTPYSFQVTMRRAPAGAVRRPAAGEWGGMNERQIVAMQYLQQRGRITNREYRDLCPEVSQETLRLDLADMVDKGLVMKVGDKKGTYYILK